MTLKLSNTKLVLSFQAEGFNNFDFACCTIIIHPNDDDEIKWECLDRETGKWKTPTKRDTVALKRIYKENAKTYMNEL
jgi:hypothetical protein